MVASGEEDSEVADIQAAWSPNTQILKHAESHEPGISPIQIKHKADAY